MNTIEAKARWVHDSLVAEAKRLEMSGLTDNAESVRQFLKTATNAELVALLSVPSNKA